jgi:hypothetical protein
MATVNDLKMYIELNKNILTQGKHGVGKTQKLMQACEELGLKMAYYSAPTLDPYTDLVGVPVPTTLPDGTKVLESIRPHKLDDADVVFVDELNRAEPKTQNAFFEIVQFHTINGEKLPKLKCVVAAQNPADDEEEYAVGTLDPAFADRFDIYLNEEAKPDKGYFLSTLGEQFGEDRAKTVVNGLFAWIKDLKDNADYISPRRLLGIAKLVLEMQDAKKPYNKIQGAIEHSMPPGSAWPHGALTALLLGDPKANPENDDYDFGGAEREWIRDKADSDQMAKWFINPDTKDDDREHVIKSIASIRIDRLLTRFSPMFEVFTEANVKDVVTAFNSPGKEDIFRQLVEDESNCPLKEKTRENILKWVGKKG